MAHMAGKGLKKLFYAISAAKLRPVNVLQLLYDTEGNILTVHLHDSGAGHDHIASLHRGVAAPKAANKVPIRIKFTEGVIYILTNLRLQGPSVRVVARPCLPQLSQNLAHT